MTWSNRTPRVLKFRFPTAIYFSNVTSLRAVAQNRTWTDIVRNANSLECSWNVMAHCDAREGKWRGNWRMDWVASTLHTTSEHGVSNITTADAHTSAASSRLNWRPHRFKCTRPFRRKTKSGFCACAITFQTRSTCNRRLFPNRTVRKVDPFIGMLLRPWNKEMSGLLRKDRYARAMAARSSRHDGFATEAFLYWRALWRSR